MRLDGPRYRWRNNLGGAIEAEVESRVVGETAWVRARGDLDLSSVPALERALDLAASRDGVDEIVLDLRALRFIDSSGLRLVLATDARMRREGRRFALVKGPRGVHRVFELAVLEDRLVFVDGAGGPFADE